MGRLNERHASTEIAERQDSGRFRNLTNGWRGLFLVFTLGGIFLSLNQIFNLKFFADVVILSNSYLYLLLGCYLSLVFLIFPATKHSSRDRVPWYDIALFAVSLGCTIYFAANGLRSLEEGWEYDSPTLPAGLALLMWAVVMEAARRAGGLAIFFVFGVLSLYPVVADMSWMPVIFSGMGQDLVGTARYHLMS